MMMGMDRSWNDTDTKKSK